MSNPFIADFTKSDRAPTSDENLWAMPLKLIGLSLGLAFGVRTFIAEPRFIPSVSMLPTIKVGDRILVNKLSYSSHLPRRDDIVVFNPTAPLLKLHVEDALIKRIIGLPGEKVQVKGGIVYINNRPLKEDFIAAKPNYTWGPQVVPPNSYFVLGDNRNQSYDGHYWGFVPRGNIVGQAVLRYWPWERMCVSKCLEQNQYKHQWD